MVLSHVSGHLVRLPSTGVGGVMLCYGGWAWVTGEALAYSATGEGAFHHTTFVCDCNQLVRLPSTGVGGVRGSQIRRESVAASVAASVVQNMQNACFKKHAAI